MLTIATHWAEFFKKLRTLKYKIYNYKIHARFPPTNENIVK